MIPLLEPYSLENRARRKRILFVCSGNACRSQIAEGWTRALFGSRVEALSAGVEAHGLDPHAVSVMAELGIDISQQRSKPFSTFAHTRVDLIVTLSDRAAGHLRSHGVTQPAIHVPCPAPAKRLLIGETPLSHYRALGTRSATPSGTWSSDKPKPVSPQSPSDNPTELKHDETQRPGSRHGLSGARPALAPAARAPGGPQSPEPSPPSPNLYHARTAMFDTHNTHTYDVRAALFAAGLLAAFTLPRFAHAADIVKANNANDLNLTTSWAGGVLPGQDDTAVFNSTVTANRTTSLGANSAWAGIRLSGNAKTWTINGAYTLSLGAGGLDLSQAGNTFSLSAPLAVQLASPQAWSVANARQLTVSATVAGEPGSPLVKEGDGVLVLSGANTYAGGTLLNAGTLSIGNNDALGQSLLTVSNGILKASAAGYVVTNPITLAGLATVSNTVNLTLNGDLSGPGTLLRPVGLGNLLILGGNNTFSGGTTNGSTVQLNSASALGTGPVTLLDGGTLKPGPNVFGTGNAGGITNTIVLLGTGIVTSVANVNIVISGPVTGPGSLSKTVNGDLTLSGNNTYSGGTAFSGGRIRLGHVNGLGTGPLTFDGWGIFVINSAIGNGAGGRGITNDLIRAEATATAFGNSIGGPGETETKSLAGGSAVALVWRDPYPDGYDKENDNWTGKGTKKWYSKINRVSPWYQHNKQANNGGKYDDSRDEQSDGSEANDDLIDGERLDGYHPHRILFFKQLDK
jgi:autotransporter-associated beta strand protein